MNLIHKFNTPPPMKYKCGICASDMTEEEFNFSDYCSECLEHIN